MTAARGTSTVPALPTRLRTSVSVLTVGLALVLLAACSSHSQVPRSWIAQEYDRRGAYYLADDRPRVVTAAISDHATPRDRLHRGGRYYLRYRNDIVSIRERAGGSRIEIADYRSGYRQWRDDVGSAWPAPGTSGGGHRGGGSGSGGK